MNEISALNPSGAEIQTPDTMPHSVEAEQQLLGAVLTNNDVYDRVASIIGAQHFYDPVHARIFETAAARIANAAGCAMIICRGDHDHPIAAIRAGARHSWFAPNGNPESARRAWILGSLAREGALVLDPGAADAVRKGRSLLPAGVVDVQGRFERGATVRLLTATGERLGVGVAGYDDHEARQILGLKSESITGVLGYRRGVALIHAGDLVLDPDSSAS